MTLPSSGPISTTDIATEIGISPPIDITGAQARTLSGVASGPVTLPGDFYGKSWFQADFSIGAQTTVSAGGGNLRTRRDLTSSIVGGSGSYTYAWSILSGSAHNNLVGTTTANSQLGQTYDPNGAGLIPETSNVQLVVTDTVTGLISTVQHSVSIS